MRCNTCNFVFTLTSGHKRGGALRVVLQDICICICTRFIELNFVMPSAIYKMESPLMLPFQVGLSRVFMLMSTLSCASFQLQDFVIGVRKCSSSSLFVSINSCKVGQDIRCSTGDSNLMHYEEKSRS